MHSAKRLELSLARVLAWVQQHDYKGYEPADGNASALHFLTAKRIMPMRLLQQVVLRSPFNIRPLIGVAPHESAIGRSYLAWAYLTQYQREPIATVRDEARACLAWLVSHRSPFSAHFCWGDPYEYATRNGRRPLGEPLLIWSAFIGMTFLDAADVLRDETYLDVAKSVGRWIATLPTEETPTGSCLSYVAYKQASIHNASAMGAAFLARLGLATGSAESFDIARDAMLYTCSRQRPDGSWYYAEPTQYHWVDNFHTGYILSALQVYRTASDDRSFDENLLHGLTYYKARFFEGDGRPKYYHDRTYPIDIQCAAQAIETLVACVPHDPACLRLAVDVADWTIARLQAPDGHFAYRDLGWRVVSTPMLHWGQGTMAKALAVLVSALDRTSL